MVWVPLNAMCSNMCARPVLPIGSCTEPASTLVKNENTGAVSGRWQMTAVSPFASFLTVTRFSKEARSWAKQNEESSNARVASLRARDIEPPREWYEAICYGRETRFEVSSRDFVKRSIRICPEFRGKAQLD